MSAALLVATAASSAQFSGRVVGVSDGDTLTVLTDGKVQVKVRLTGIDAPEKGQAFGNRAKEGLSALVFNKQVVVEWKKTDRYGRTLGRVMVGETDANLEQIRAGLAWHYKDYAKDQEPSQRMAYAEAELNARKLRKGLWAEITPQPPWEFRKSHMNETKVTSPCPCSGQDRCTGEHGGKYCFAPNGKKKYGYTP